MINLFVWQDDSQDKDLSKFMNFLLLPIVSTIEQ